MKKKYELTPEHREQLKPWADKWIANAMSTKPMDEEDRAIAREAAKGLYIAAGLMPPPDERIVFVPSPFVLRFAAGYASAIWWIRKNDKVPTWAATEAATRAATEAATEAATRDATEAATEAATWDATRDATRAATRAATWDATEAATWDATRAATEAATRDATWDATEAATRDATRAATEAATRDATWDATEAATRDEEKEERKNWFVFGAKKVISLAFELKLGKFGLSCAYHSSNMLQGGNQWSGYTAYISFFRYISGLKLDYSKWDHWEKLTEHSGSRIIHPDFCMISDRPEILMVDDQNRPHCENGPFCKWRDGSALYAWHGAYVPAEWIEDRSTITPEIAMNWENAEQRRAAMEMIGWQNMLDLLGAKLIDEDNDPTIGLLYEADHESLGGKCKFLKMYCPTGRWFAEPVPPEMKTALEANSWGWSLKPWEYKPELQA